MAVNDPNADPQPAAGGAFNYDGTVHWEYAPDLDGDPDPGEIVWTWVAYEDDPSVGKDRPVAVVGRSDDQRLVVLMLSSKDHDDDRGWIAIGSGPWDRDGRPSWVRRDRILAVAPGAVRREGAVMPRATYDTIVSVMAGGSAPTSSASPKGSAQASRAPGGMLGGLKKLFRRAG